MKGEETMIQGRYVKDNHFTEVYLGNGITQIVPAAEYDPPMQPIQYFTWPKEVRVEVVKKRSRNWIWWTVGAATFLCGASLSALLDKFYYAAPLFICSLAYIGLVVYANKK